MPLCGLISATFISGAVNIILMWKVLGPNQLGIGIVCVVPIVFLLFVLIAAIYQFIKRMWFKGTFNLFVLIVIGLLGTIPISSRLDSHDDFGKNIVIPKDMVVENPLGETASVGSAAVDAESNELVHSFKK